MLNFPVMLNFPAKPCIIYIENSSIGDGWRHLKLCYIFKQAPMEMRRTRTVTLISFPPILMVFCVITGSYKPTLNNHLQVFNHGLYSTISIDWNFALTPSSRKLNSSLFVNKRVWKVQSRLPEIQMNWPVLWSPRCHRTNALTNFHEEWTINVTLRALKRFY